MTSLWDISKALRVPLDNSIRALSEIPYTVSYVIRKLRQIDNLMELPKDKRPPSRIIWEGTSEDIEEWIDRVVRKKEPQEINLIIGDIEG